MSFSYLTHPEPYSTSKYCVTLHVLDSILAINIALQTPASGAELLIIM